MEKYLLINNYTNYSYDDEITSNAYVIGSFDSIEKCIDACEDDLLDQAQNNVSDLPDEEAKEYIDKYVSGFNNNGITEEDFRCVGDFHYVMEHWYNNGNEKIENQFMVVRLS